jgi:hypothetical protein
MISELVDPLDRKPIGDVPWLHELTGWGHDKIARLARDGRIPGAFQAYPGRRGAKWSFRKTKVLHWLKSLEVH